MGKTNDAPRRMTGALIFFLAAMTLAGADEIICTDYAVRGEGITLFFLTDSPENFSKGEVILIRDNGKTASRSRFFLLPSREEGDESLWCALLGVPSDLEKGTYTLNCRMEGMEGNNIFQKPLAVSDREFPSEILELNQSLTDIRTVENPEKTAQAQHLWSILAGFEGDSIFQQDSFVSPMEEHRTTTDFGTRRIYRYVDGKEAVSIHNGEDWAAPTGTPIYAAGAGRVVCARERIVTGNTVIVEMLPGVFLLYYHLDSLAVEEGDMVEAGENIGFLGMTGLATGPHLHWEMRISKVAVDPLPFLEGNLIDKKLILDKIDTTL